MEITITKSDFEKALPVGTAANDSVYESVYPAIDAQLAIAKDALLGAAGMEYLEGLGEQSTLLDWLKRLVCLSAFLSVLRQLDLVLTSTGFGVVSNDNVAPASKQRVDALGGSLKTQYWKSLGATLQLLYSAKWGATAQAKHFVNHIYTEFVYFYEKHRMASAADWDAFQPVIEEADEQLRVMMSDKQMDDILDALRLNDTARLIPYREVMELVVEYTDTLAKNGTVTPHLPVYRRLMRLLDSDENKETFKLYRESSNYLANHHESYKNTKESRGFFFNG